MDIRVLRYFLAVARLESITAAAEFLHMSQPPLSRQLKDLEDELGKQLFIRGSRKIRLTEEGRLLRRRAEEILELMEKTQDEIRHNDEDEISGWLCIGGGETQGVRIIAQIVKEMRDEYPGITIHLYSGNAEDVTDRLEHGMLDFGLVVEPVNLSEYNYIRIPHLEKWGIIMRRDDELAQKASVRPEDLTGRPVFMSAQMMAENQIAGWMGKHMENMQIAGEYHLLFNASLLVEEGAGCAMCIDGIINTSEGSPLVFRPLEPELTSGMLVIWKKNHAFSRPAKKFIEKLTANLQISDQD